MPPETPTASTAPDNLLDLLLHFYACAHEEDLVAAVSESDAGQLERLEETYRQFSSASWRAYRPIPPGEIRPFVQTSSVYDGAEWARGGFGFDVDVLATAEATWTLVDNIKQRLLYCHSVAIDDPMWLVLSRAGAERRFDANGVSQGHRALEALAGYANVLLHMKKLIRGHIVCPVVTPNLTAHDGDALKLRASLEQQISTLVTEDELRARVDIQELVRAAPPAHRQRIAEAASDGPSGPSLLADVFATIGTHRLIEALAAAFESQGRATLYLPFAYDEQTLALCCARDSELAARASALGANQSYLLAKLAHLSLPGLESLTPEEIIGLRDNADEFEQWRRDLRSALLAADSVPVTAIDRGAEMERIVKDRLLESRERLDAALQQSAALSPARVGTASFIAGMLPVLVGGLFDPTTFTLAAVLGAVAAAGFDAGHGGESRRSTGQAARRAHYVAALR